MTIIGGRSPYSKYGCPANRFNGTCANSLSIRYDRLEHQLLAAIAERALRPEIVEHAIQGVRRELQRITLSAAERAKTLAAGSAKMKIELRKTTQSAQNLVRAIGTFGHNRSPTMLIELSALESRILALNEQMQEPAVPVREIADVEIRKFVSDNAQNLEGVMSENGELSRSVLRQHIKTLILTPKKSTNEQVLFVTGDVNLFSNDSNVMPLVSPMGFEPMLSP
jgi:hypothetical protein